VHIIHETPSELLSGVDLVTSSGQVRPIDASMVPALSPGCVIPLMYESWEYRSEDLDVEACRARGVLVAGTNERHPEVDVFSYLGPLAVHLLHDAGIAVYGCRIVLVCDNDFGPFIRKGLEAGGAHVSLVPRLSRSALDPEPDAAVIAMTPSDRPVLEADGARLIADSAPGTLVAQFWGDVDRAALAQCRVPVWPPPGPAVGHMAVLLLDIGPDAICRLQAAGLKVGEVLGRGLENVEPAERSLVQLT
jgi:predicted Fe-Mo cluster-binding NifX family protein